VRVLVCGGRDFRNVALLCYHLDGINWKLGISAVIHGSARGADSLADNWAKSRDIPRLRFPADWAANGRAGGPIRNRQMLVQGKPDLVVAFPGGDGTADMIRQAVFAGVKVFEVYV